MTNLETIGSPPDSELFLGAQEADIIKAESRDFRSIDLSLRELCDLELLMNGGFAPLRSFLGRNDYDSVLKRMRLSNGILWPMPVTLGVTPTEAESLEIGQQVALRDEEGELLAVLKVTDLWEPDLAEEAEAVFGAGDPTHPGVRFLHDTRRTVHVGARCWV